MKCKIRSKTGHKIIRLNRRKAIREKCLDCSGWSYVEVQNCSFTSCELYHFRSGMGKQDAKARERSIREYCLFCMGGQRSEVSNCPSKDCSLFPYRKSKVDRSVEIIDSKPKKQRIERPRRKDISRPIPKYGAGVSG